MKGPPIGQPNLAALIGAITGAVSGLFAVGVAPAIAVGSLRLLVAYPNISFVCFLISGPIGWLLGGQIGPRLERRYPHVQAHWIAGIAAGLIPFVLIVLWGWYMYAT